MVSYHSPTCFVTGSNTDSTASFNFPCTVSFYTPPSEPEEITNLKAKAKQERISVTKLIRKALPNRTGYKERKEFWR
jgi:hypothetical protein